MIPLFQLSLILSAPLERELASRGAAPQSRIIRKLGHGIQALSCRLRTAARLPLIFGVGPVASVPSGPITRDLQLVSRHTVTIRLRIYDWPLYRPSTRNLAVDRVPVTLAFQDDVLLRLTPGAAPIVVPTTANAPTSHWTNYWPSRCTDLIL